MDVAQVSSQLCSPEGDPHASHALPIKQILKDTYKPISIYDLIRYIPFV